MKEIKIDNKQCIESIIEEYPILNSCLVSGHFSSQKINTILGYHFVTYQRTVTSDLIKSILEEFQKAGLDITKELHENLSNKLIDWELLPSMGVFINERSS